MLKRFFIGAAALVIFTGQAALAQTEVPLAEQTQLYEQLATAIDLDNAPTLAYLLREKRLNPNHYLPNGDTPLTAAIRSQSWKSVHKVLLKSYALNVSQPNLHGETPLMLAAFKNQLPLVQALVDKGAQVNGGINWTALHYAATAGHTPIVQWLIEHGAHVNARTDRGVTPLYMAARGGHQEAALVLLKNGADAQWCTDQGLSPYQAAHSRGFQALSEHLRIDACHPDQPTQH